MVNENKVAFIICYNNELYMQECMKYISRIQIPEGIETDVIGVEGAESMAAGYNAAMESSDAKYKVYMHQDVFILNRNLIEDILRIFRENPEYGLLGLIGTDKQVMDANYWNAWNIGMTAASDAANQGMVIRDNREGIMPALVVDGMMMITQYDVRWREDIFDGFDFYDMSQSMEFHAAGYQVGIPYQETAWCNHDCGPSKLKSYDYYREKFCEEYRKYGYEFKVNEEQCQSVIRYNETEKILPQIEQEIQSMDIEKAMAMLKNTIKFYSLNNKLQIYYIICSIIYEENVWGTSDRFYNQGMSVSAMNAKFNRYKFFLRRIELDFPIEDEEEILEELLERKEKQIIDLSIMAQHVNFEPEKVLWKLKWILWQKCKQEYVGLDYKFQEKRIRVTETAAEVYEIIKKLASMEERIIRQKYISVLKEVYHWAMCVDCKDGALHKNRNFHFYYYDMLICGLNTKQFIGECLKWMESLKDI